MRLPLLIGVSHLGKYKPGGLMRMRLLLLIGVSQ